MAGDAGGIDPSQSGLIAGAAAVIGAAIGGVCLWLANRLMGKAAFQTAINNGFSELIKRMEENHAAERAMWKATELQLNGRIVNLEQTVRSLKDQLRREGALPGVREDRYAADPLITIPPEDEV